MLTLVSDCEKCGLDFAGVGDVCHACTTARANGWLTLREYERAGRPDGWVLVESWRLIGYYYRPLDAFDFLHGFAAFLRDVWATNERAIRKYRKHKVLLPEAADGLRRAQRLRVQLRELHRAAVAASDGAGQIELGTPLARLWFRLFLVSPERRRHWNASGVKLRDLIAIQCPEARAHYTAAP